MTVRNSKTAKPETPLVMTVLMLAVAAALFSFSAAVSAMLSQQIFASTYFLIGTSILLLAGMFVYLRRQHAQREHRLLTAVVAADSARAQAETAAREKTRMLATMSHEIRTPLNGVIGMLALLDETELTLEQRNYAHTAHSSGRTLLSIIDEILDTARVESKGHMQRCAVDPIALVENITELLSPRAHAKGLEISARVAITVPREIIVDELRLRQILFNLAGNAIKFTQSGGVAVVLSWTSDLKLQVEVQDTGIGMTREECGRVFGEFVQANADTRHNFGGTGLGLSISHKLVLAMGGSIEVSSEPGRGTQFKVLVPVGLGLAPKSEEAPLAGRSFVVAMMPGFARQHLQITLEELGAAVTCIETERELALLLAGPKPLRQFICTVQFGTVLKSWARKQKRSRAQWHNSVFVLLKAEERKDHAMYLEPPFAGYLLKPLRRSTLLNQLAVHDGKSLKQASKLLGRSSAKPKTLSLARKSGRRSLRVLLAEDNMVNAMLARTILERAGHRVHLVSDGVAALAALQGGARFDVAVLDVEMPKLSGLNVARAIRKDAAYARFRQLPLLALTANSQAENIRECQVAGMNDHLAKPFERIDLEEKIQQMTKMKDAA